MAVSLNDIKKNRLNTKNTSQITNAMQMVSAAKLGRSEECSLLSSLRSVSAFNFDWDILHGNGAGAN